MDTNLCLIIQIIRIWAAHTRRCSFLLSADSSKWQRIMSHQNWFKQRKPVIEEKGDLTDCVCLFVFFKKTLPLNNPQFCARFSSIYNNSQFCARFGSVYNNPQFCLAGIGFPPTSPAFLTLWCMCVTSFLN